MCRTRCRVLGFEIEIVECEKQLFLLVNRENEKVAAIGMCGAGEGKAKIESFVIDVRKWMWAEAEGFSMEQMVDPKSPLRESIFLRSSFEDLPELLK
jgi:hypothetical protein